MKDTSKILYSSTEINGDDIKKVYITGGLFVVVLKDESTLVGDPRIEVKHYTKEGNE